MTGMVAEVAVGNIVAENIVAENIRVIITNHDMTRPEGMKAARSGLLSQNPGKISLINQQREYELPEQCPNEARYVASNCDKHDKNTLTMLFSTKLT
jgi:hypothetical protein